MAESVKHDFGGTSVVVTGGASGIGLAAAEAFIRAGADVAIWDRNVPAATRVASELERKYERLCIAVELDQRDPVAVQAAVVETVGTLGGIDVLIANAGIARLDPFLDISSKHWQLMMDVNLNGTFYVCQSVARHMAETGTAGRIVVNASMASRQNSNGCAHYCTSKAGVDMLVRCMAVELGPYGIRVNAVGPGVIETPLTAGTVHDESLSELLVRTTPAGRLGAAEDVADVMLFLASDAARFIDGQTVNVCGGMSTPSVPNYQEARATIGPRAD